MQLKLVFEFYLDKCWKIKSKEMWGWIGLSGCGVNEIFHFLGPYVYYPVPLAPNNWDLTIITHKLWGCDCLMFLQWKKLLG